MPASLVRNGFRPFGEMARDEFVLCTQPDWRRRAHDDTYAVLRQHPRTQLARQKVRVSSDENVIIDTAPLCNLVIRCPAPERRSGIPDAQFALKLNVSD
jgi:hypothetical protein